MVRLLALASLLASTFAHAQDDGAPAWLQPGGVEGYAWGSDAMPLDALPRPRDFVLPDSHYIGATKGERPDDLELKAPPGERRFVRYAHGQLVDAWWISDKRLDPAVLVESAKPDWMGVVLGPAEDGFLAYGVATSWTVGGRTVLHWKDRLGKREVIASRAAPTPQYGIGRPSPLERPEETRSRAKVTGDLRKAAQPFVGSLSSCFDTSPMPVVSTIALRLDPRGLPSRIKVTSDQPAFNLEDCVAAALMDLKGEPGAAGSLELMRFQ